MGSLSGKCINVLYLTDLYPEPRGKKWIKSMRDVGVNVLVVSFRKGFCQIWEPDDHTVFLRAPFPKNPFSVIRWISVRSVINRLHFLPDVTFVRDIFQGLVAKQIAREYNSILIADIADNYPEVVGEILGGLPVFPQLARAVFDLVEGIVYRSSDVLICVSERSADYLQKKHGIKDNGPFLIMPNVPDLESIQRPLLHGRSKEGIIRGIYLGTFDKKIRDFKTVLLGLQKYNQMGQLPVVITAQTFEPDMLRSYLSSLDRNWSSHITVTSALKNNVFMYELGQYDFGLIPHVRSPATDFTIPNKFYDYLVAGIPVFTSDNPAIRDLLERYPYGLAYRGGDSESFARVLIQLVEGLSHYKEIIKNDYGRLQHELCWGRAFDIAWRRILQMVSAGMR